jgi:hypothetical protein
MLGCAGNQQQHSPEMTGFPARTERHCCGMPEGLRPSREIAMSKAQKGNKEKKKPKADKNQPKTHVSAYKAAQDQAKPSFNPFAKKT